jgi:hypothetical protein
MNTQFESTYGLLVRCEEKGRGVLEIAVYAVFILSVAFTIWQFAQAPMQTSVPEPKPSVAHETTTSLPPAGT